MKATMLRTAIALSAICYAFAAQAISQEEAPKPLPPQEKNFPLDQTWELRELSASRSTALFAARASPAATRGRRRSTRSRTSISPSALTR
jgi:hypothetical protein